MAYAQFDVEAPPHQASSTTRSGYIRIETPDTKLNLSVSQDQLKAAVAAMDDARYDPMQAIKNKKTADGLTVIAESDPDMDADKVVHFKIGGATHSVMMTDSEFEGMHEKITKVLNLAGVY